MQGQPQKAVDEGDGFFNDGKETILDGGKPKTRATRSLERKWPGETVGGRRTARAGNGG
jgi:hypothetical protein